MEVAEGTLKNIKIGVVDDKINTAEFIMLDQGLIKQIFAYGTSTVELPEAILIE